MKSPQNRAGFSKTIPIPIHFPLYVTCLKFVQAKSLNALVFSLRTRFEPTILLCYNCLYLTHFGASTRMEEGLHELLV